MQWSRAVHLTDFDSRFVVDTASSGASDPERLKGMLHEDDAFRQGMAGDPRVFERVMDDEEVFVRISPGLYFEILLRQAQRELRTARFTMERNGSQSVAVFDAEEVTTLLGQEPVVDYLAAMLASFTKTHSYTTRVRVKPNVWRRSRISDIDIDSLTQLCANAPEDGRMPYYKRIADLCLFIVGIFPEHATSDYRYPGIPVRPYALARARRGAQEYEDEGRRFYKLAGQHPLSKTMELAEVFHLLHAHFTAAKKPLNFIATHYFRRRGDTAFQA